MFIVILTQHCDEEWKRQALPAVVLYAYMHIWKLDKDVIAPPKAQRLRAVIKIDKDYHDVP